MKERLTRSRSFPSRYLRRIKEKKEKKGCELEKLTKESQGKGKAREKSGLTDSSLEDVVRADSGHLSV